VKQVSEDESFKTLMNKMNEEVKYMSGEDFEKRLREQRINIGNLIKINETIMF